MRKLLNLIGLGWTLLILIWGSSVPLFAQNLLWRPARSQDQEYGNIPTTPVWSGTNYWINTSVDPNVRFTIAPGNNGVHVTFDQQRHYTGIYADLLSPTIIDGQYNFTGVGDPAVASTMTVTGGGIWGFFGRYNVNGSGFNDASNFGVRAGGALIVNNESLAVLSGKNDFGSISLNNGGVVIMNEGAIGNNTINVTASSNAIIAVTPKYDDTYGYGLNDQYRVETSGTIDNITDPTKPTNTIKISNHINVQNYARLAIVAGNNYDADHGTGYIYEINFSNMSAANGGAITLITLSNLSWSSDDIYWATGNKSLRPATPPGGNITFENNRTTTGDGGAIYFARSNEEINLVNGISKLVFTGNTANFGGGGAIYVGGGSGILNLNANDVVSFIGNGADVGGGAIYSINSMVIGQVDFINNTADHNLTDGRNGGGAIWGGGTITINGTTFEGNYATNGGAIYSDSTSAVTVNGGQFAGNRSQNDNLGSAIYANGNITLNGKVQFLDNYVYNQYSAPTPLSQNTILRTHGTISTANNTYTYLTGGMLQLNPTLTRSPSGAESHNDIIFDNTNTTNIVGTSVTQGFVVADYIKVNNNGNVYFNNVGIDTTGAVSVAGTDIDGLFELAETYSGVVQFDADTSFTLAPYPPYISIDPNTMSQTRTTKVDGGTLRLRGSDTGGVSFLTGKAVLATDTLSVGRNGTIAGSGLIIVNNSVGNVISGTISPDVFFDDWNVHDTPPDRDNISIGKFTFGAENGSSFRMNAATLAIDIVAVAAGKQSDTIRFASFVPDGSGGISPSNGGTQLVFDTPKLGNQTRYNQIVIGGDDPQYENVLWGSGEGERYEVVKSGKIYGIKDGSQKLLEVRDDVTYSGREINDYFAPFTRYNPAIGKEGLITDRKQVVLKIEKNPVASNLLNPESAYYFPYVIAMYLSDGNNIYLAWNGDNNSNWDTTTNNWHRDGTATDTNNNGRVDTTIKFIDGDFVIFRNDVAATDGLGNLTGSTLPITSQSITLANNLTTVKGMWVESGGYTFNGVGKRINGIDILDENKPLDEAFVLKEDDPYSGMLVISSNGQKSVTNSTGVNYVQLETTINVETNFVNGVRLGAINGAGNVVVVLGDDMALGSTDDSLVKTKTRQKRGLIDVINNTSLKTLADRTIANKIDIAANKRLTLDIASGKTLTIDNANASDLSGGVYEMNDGDKGGAIYVDGTLTAATDSGSLVVSNTTFGARNGGGIYLTSSGTLDYNNLTSLTIDSNKAVNGGGIYTEGDLVILSETDITNNHATGDGGGIYANSNLTVYGNTNIKGNTADNNGDAIYMVGGETITKQKTLSLVANNDNKVNGKSVHGDIDIDDNGIYLNQNTTINTSGLGDIYLRDINSGNTGGNTMNLSMDSVNQFVQIRENSVLNNANSYNGYVNVNSGTLRLANDAIFETYLANTASHALTIAANGGIAGNGEFITNGSMLISGRIAPDNATLVKVPITSTDVSSITDVDRIGTLTLTPLTPDKNITFSGATYVVDLNVGGLASGIDDGIAGTNNDYLILNNNVKLDLSKKSTVDIGEIIGKVTPNDEIANNSFKIASTTGSNKFLTGGLAIGNYFNAVTDGGNIIGDRETATVEFREDETELWLTVTKGDNMQIVWTGYDGTTSNPVMNWNLTNENWRRNDQTNPIDPIQFLNGDYVIFDNSGRDAEPVNIRLDGTTTSVSGMEIISGKYIFDGEYLNSTKFTSLALPTADQEVLKVIGGSVQMNLKTNFAGGVSLSGGAIVIGHDKAFGVTNKDNAAGQIRVTGSASIGSAVRTVKTWYEVNPIDDTDDNWEAQYVSVPISNFEVQNSITVDDTAGSIFYVNAINPATNMVTNGIAVKIYVPSYTYMDFYLLDDNGNKLNQHIPFKNVLTIKDNAWSAIRLGENARLETAGGGELSFVNNGSDTDIDFGGAIYAANHFHSEYYGLDTNGNPIALRQVNDIALMDFSGLNGVDGSSVGASFFDNKATLAGGAIYTEGHLQIDGTLYFENNSAGLGGGAIASADGKNIELKGSAAFISNSAASGGAIYGNNVKIADGSLFGENTADLGGAIFANGDLTVKGNTAFIYNSADVGDAIYMNGIGTTADKNVSLNLNTNDGNIVFAFNDSGNTNAIYLNDATTITVSGKNNVYFGGYDGGTYARDSIGVNKNNVSGKGSNLIVRNSGFVQFTGDSTLSYASQSNHGYISVESGSLRVVDNVKLATAGKVQLQGGTLAGGGTIVAGDGFELASGRLSADSYIYALPAYTNDIAETMPEDYRIGTLTLNGNAVINAITLDVDLDYGNRSDLVAITGNASFADEGAGLSSVNIASAWRNGTFNIMTASGGGLDDYADYITKITFGGNPLGERQHAQLSSNGNTIQLKTTAEGIGVIWTGAADPERDTYMDWNTTDANWKEYDSSKVASFSGTDYVYFTGNANGEITIKGEFVEVGGMSITNGRYWFTGGEIHGVDYANAAYQEGVLKMYNGEVKFDTTAKFERDITVSGGSATITTKGKLESTNGSVNFGANSSLTLELCGLVEYITPNPDTSSPITGITNYKPAEQHTYIDARRVTINGKVNIANAPDGQQYYSYMYPTGNTIASPTHGLTPEPIVFKNVIVSDTPLDMNSLAQAFNTSDGLFGQFVTFNADEQGSGFITLPVFAASNRFNPNSWNTLSGQLAMPKNGKYTMNLNYGFITLSEFATANKTSHNKAQAAAILDAGFAEGQFAELRDEMYKMSANAQVDAVLNDNRGVEMAADVMYMAMTKPWREAFHRLSQGRIAYSNAFTADYRGQWYSKSQREFWFAGIHRTLDAEGDGNAREFGYSRTGAVVGVDWQFDSYTEAGIMFSYTEPRLYSPFGKVESYDYSIGIYGRRYLYNDWYFNGYLGVATQKHRYRRNADSALYKNDYYGNGLYASTEFYRPVQCSLFTLLPGFALDFQSVYADGFRENNSVDAIYGQRISSTDLGQLMVRFGLNGKWNPHEMVSVDTRLQYAFQVMGDTYSTVTSRLQSSPTSSMSIRGVDMGSDIINMGFGVKTYLSQRRNAYLAFNYDQDYGVRYVSHSVDLSLTTRW